MELGFRRVSSSEPHSNESWAWCYFDENGCWFHTDESFSRFHRGKSPPQFHGGESGFLLHMDERTGFTQIRV